MIAPGAEAVRIGEGAASSSVISPACYAEFVAPYAKAVMDAAKERGIPSFLHVCGNIVPGIREIAATGCLVAPKIPKENINAMVRASKAMV